VRKQRWRCGGNDPGLTVWADQDIALARPLQRLGEFRPIRRGAGRDLHEHLVATDRLEGIELQGMILRVL
jgi:hypothetical protein